MLKRILKSRYLNLIKSKQKWEDINTRFIVSAGRTGTKFFADFFNNNFSGIYSLHEPKPNIGKLGVDQFREGLSSKFVMKSLYYKRRLILNELYTSNCDYYVESNPKFRFLLPYIKEIFPHYKILVIIRDLRTYLVSAYNKSPDNSHENFFYDLEDEQKRILPHDLEDEKYMKRWENFGREEKLAWYWVTANNYLIRNTIKDQNCLLIKFEDIFHPDKKQTELNKICDFFEIPNARYFYKNDLLNTFSSKKNATQFSYLNSFNELPVWKQRRILNIGRECIQTYYTL